VLLHRRFVPSVERRFDPSPRQLAEDEWLTAGSDANCCTAPKSIATFAPMELQS
jgi:hypothetical protein